MASKVPPKSVKLQPYRICILGSGGIGKTSFVNQVQPFQFVISVASPEPNRTQLLMSRELKFCLRYFGEIYDPTLEDNFRKQAVIDGADYMIELLDTSGPDEYATALRDQFLRDSDASLILYSITSKESFEKVGSFWEQVKKIKNEQGMWDPYQICVLGTKSDLKDDRRVVTEEDGEKCAQKFGCAFKECSAKTAENVEKAVFDLVRKTRTYKDNERIRYEKMREEAEKARMKDERSKKSLWKRILSR